MRDAAIGLIGVAIFGVLALFLLGQAASQRRCDQWIVRATPLDFTSLQEQRRDQPLVQTSLETGWEPFAGSVREERQKGKIEEPVLRPYVFARRCVER